MLAAGALRRQPYKVTEVVLVVLVALAAVAYTGLVFTTTPGAWTTANAMLLLVTALDLVLVAHAVRDFHRLATVDGWPGSIPLAVAGAFWRLTEIVLATAFVVGGLLTGLIAADLPNAEGSEAEGTLGMVVGMWVLFEAFVVGVLFLMVVARVLATGGGGGDAAATGDAPAGGDGTPGAGPAGDTAPADAGDPAGGAVDGAGTGAGGGASPGASAGDGDGDEDGGSEDEGSGYVPRSSG